MPLLMALVPGAHPAAAPIAGAQLIAPSGAGVVPGVAFVRVNAPGEGTDVTPVVPVGEFAAGLADG
jgi:hypothetical protein